MLRSVSLKNFLQHLKLLMLNYYLCLVKYGNTSFDLVHAYYGIETSSHNCYTCAVPACHIAYGGDNTRELVTCLMYYGGMLIYLYLHYYSVLDLH